MHQIGVVVIGRNEGNRLKHCLLSVVGEGRTIVYVDSGSTDNSVELAKSFGVHVVKLDLSVPFTAARARNAGFTALLELKPSIEFVQFVDGDCRVVENWLKRAVDELIAHPDVVVVCGRRREEFPNNSMYNRFCNMEWDTPVGEAKACGGDAMMRVEAFKKVGGFNPTLIAGEEPELCVRLRQAGGKINRIDAEMTLHDAQITRLSQWWKRSLRGGHAYAEGAWLHGSTPEKHWVKESRSIWLWGLLLPLLAIATAWFTWGFSILLLVIAYTLLIYRMYRYWQQRGYKSKDAISYSVFCALDKFPQLQGQIKFHVSRLLNKQRTIVEYKSATSTDFTSAVSAKEKKYIAIVGSGFVADYYLQTLPLHPQLELVGVMDRISDRSSKFAAFYNVPHIYDSLEEILKDPKVDIVLNLTNPSSHYAVSKACLEAGKHVYSEKPLAMEMSQAHELVNLAKQRGLYLSSAPCSLLSETAQTVWKALRENQIGKVRLVYAEMDDGLVHKMPYSKWLNESGTPWPYKDEFEVGCTLEHAGYYVTWLTAFFGPAEIVSAFSSCIISDKETDVKLDINAPDFSVACIKFASGVVARLTCSIIAPHDHSLKIIGDEGVLGIDDAWFYGAQVYIRRSINIGYKRWEGIWKQSLPLAKKAPRLGYRGAHKMDFCRGVAEMASAIAEQRSPRLSAEFSLHNNELVLAIHNALETGCTYKMTTSFEQIEPMPWAK